MALPLLLSVYFPSICATTKNPSQPVDKLYIFALAIDRVLSQGFGDGYGTEIQSYRSGGVLLVAALASDLEGDVVGGVALDLDGTGRDVVEVLVEQLEGKNSISVWP